VLECIRKLHCPSDRFFHDKAAALIQPYLSSLHPESVPLLTDTVITFLVNGLKIRIEHEDRTDIIGSGLFYLTSHCNHSCLPNAEWTTTMNRQTKITLKSVRSIQKGEEISISYFGHNHSFRDIAFWMSHLLRGWNFRCKCSRCSAEFDDVRRYRTLDGYTCAKNKDYSEKYQAERDFVQSKLWRDINQCDLSSYGSTPKGQLSVIEDAIRKLKAAGLHETHYLLLELSFPKAALFAAVHNDYGKVLIVIEERSTRLNSLCPQPNVRLLNNEMEYIDALQPRSVSEWKQRLKHTQNALRIAYILYPKDEHPTSIKLKRLLLETEQRLQAMDATVEYEDNVCVICRKTGVKKRCGRCHKAFYCGATHQRDHWKVHKVQCKKR